MEEKTLTFKIPQGWGYKLVTRTVIVVLVLALFPFYTSYVRKIEAESKMEAAKIEAEAMKILGNCKLQ